MGPVVLRSKKGRANRRQQVGRRPRTGSGDRKSTRLNSSHDQISYAVFCLKKKKKRPHLDLQRTRLTASHDQRPHAAFSPHSSIPTPTSCIGFITTASPTPSQMYPSRHAHCGT